LAIAWRCLRDPMFSRFDTVPACDRRTDGQAHGQTDGHMTTAYTVHLAQSFSCVRVCVRTITFEWHDLDLHIRHAGSTWTYLYRSSSKVKVTGQS